MGQFFKFIFASCLGVSLAIIALLGVGSMIVGKIVMEADKPKAIKPNTVLRLTLDEAIPEKTNNVNVQPTDFSTDKILGLSEMVQTIENAKEDDRVKGILLEVDGIYAGFSTATTLQNALVDFKESGKFIIAYSKYYTQGAYYLASAADKVYLNPLGIIDFRGFAAQVPFFKEMLDNIGIKMQVFYAGKFKSATEPYRRNEMSKENRVQIREYLDGIYNIYLEGISENRGVPVSQLKALADEYKGSEPKDALAHGLIDAIGYRDEALSEIRTKIGLDEGDKLYTLSLQDYNKANPPSTDYSKRNRIAVVYAEGTIVDGKGEPGSVADDKYTKIIRKLKNDDRIKAVVLRVNSPGGSAMSSENIWRELTLLKDTGKPIVVSMGDYAASGGYYIACMADSIFAQPNTLTGSIGVFNMIPSTTKLMDEKLGINFDTVRTGQFSVGISPYFDLSPAEQRIIQARTDSLYKTFLKRVGDGRDMDVKDVNEIAQGRVWTGLKAKEIGLVDKIGDLDQAIASAAILADIGEYRISEYPNIKDPFLQLIESYLGIEETRTEAFIKSELGDLFPYYQQVKTVQEFSAGPQARLPYFFPFE